MPGLEYSKVTEVDQPTIERFRAGDVAAAEDVFLAFHKRLIGFARLFTGRLELAEEVVQEVFVLTFRHREKIRGPAELKTWLFTLTRREAIREAKRSRNKAEIGIDEELIEKLAGSEDGRQKNGLRLAEFSRHLQGALAELTPRDRELIVLRYFQELQIKEIAEVLGLPMGSVGVMLRRALDKVQKHFAGQGLRLEDFF